jgi:hypothetical protein
MIAFIRQIRGSESELALISKLQIFHSPQEE